MHTKYSNLCMAHKILSLHGIPSSYQLLLLITTWHCICIGYTRWLMHGLTCSAVLAIGRWRSMACISNTIKIRSWDFSLITKSNNMHGPKLICAYNIMIYTLILWMFAWNLCLRKDKNCHMYILCITATWWI